MHEYAKKCIGYNIPNTVNNITTNIIDKIYTHSMHGICKIKYFTVLPAKLYN